MELHTYLILGFELVWDFLHSGCPWTLFHWCVHSILHNDKTVPVLPYAGQHAGLPAEPQGTDLVPHVLLFWVQRQWPCSQWVLLAFLQAYHPQEADWVAHVGTMARILCYLAKILVAAFWNWQNFECQCFFFSLTLGLLQLVQVSEFKFTLKQLEIGWNFVKVFWNPILLEAERGGKKGNNGYLFNSCIFTRVSNTIKSYEMKY